MAEPYDVIIIGAGPGGYIAAIRAAQLGLKTAIVEREHMGGVCLNWGCIPTKALLRTAEIYGLMQRAKEFGLATGKLGIDAAGIVKRSRAVSGQLSNGVSFLMKKNKIDVIWGEATITRAGEVTVSKTDKEPMQPQQPVPKGVLPEGVYKAQNIIVATGARPRVLPGIEPDGERIWTYFEAMVPDEIPKSVLVMGSGAIGIEFASFYRSMGAEVTVVELLDQILPLEDAEIAAIAHKRFEKRGIRLLTGATVTKIDRTRTGVAAHVKSEGRPDQKLTAHKLISAVGVVGNTENLGLDKLGVKTERGIVAVDGFGATNVAGVWAIGDVAGPPMLAHKAEHEAVIAVEKIAGVAGVQPIDKAKIPACTYCDPQIASVGLTEAAAARDGRKVKVGRFPFLGNGKAIALGEPEGLVKTIFDANTGALIGAHLVGAEVTELIGAFVVAMNLETTEAELMETVFPHPTLSEMLKESVLDAYGRVLNI